MKRPPRFFVTATDTGVGKTQVACALLSLMAERGLRPAAFKPYESGCDDLAVPADAVALQRAAQDDRPLGEICLHRFRAPLAPGVAAEREKLRPSWAKTLSAFRRLEGRAAVVEGAGGLLVPLDGRHDVIDLIAALGLPVILVARAGLGTLNHTGLSLQALDARGIHVRAVVLSRGSPTEDPSILENGKLIQKRHGVQVWGPVPYLANEDRRRKAFRKVLEPLLA